MHIDLLDRAVSSLDDEARTRYAATLETTPETFERDYPVVCAAVLAGLMKKAARPGGEETINKIISESGNEQDDSTGASRPDDVQATIDSGLHAMDTVFGSGFDDLVGAVSHSCSLSRYQLRKLFGLACDSTVGELGEIRNRYKLDGQDVAALVLMQSGSVNAALPNNLYAALGLKRLGSHAARLKEERLEPLEKALKKGDGGGLESLLRKRLTPAAAVVLVLIVGWSLAKGCG